MTILLASLPPGPELERWARTTGALCRKRGVSGAKDLLRVALSYGFCGLSLEVAAVWAKANQSANVSKTALLRRLRQCGAWLEKVVSEKLKVRLPPVAATGGLRVRLVDATGVCSPGSKGKTWRIHTAYDPWEKRLLEVVITDDKGAEHLGRFKVGPGDLVVGDRGYAHRRGLAHVHAAGAHFLVRTGWGAVPLMTSEGDSFDVLAAGRQLPEMGHKAFNVVTVPDERNDLPGLSCRLVVLRKSAEAAEAAKNKIRSAAKKKQVTLDSRTLEACNFIYLLTSAPERTYPPELVLATYRQRWQVELEYKRLKSMMRLDEVRAKDPRLVRATLAAKILGATLVEDLIAARANGENLQHAHWKLTSVFSRVVQQVVLGADAMDRWLLDPTLSRQPPTDLKRKRRPQCLVVAAS